MAVTHSELHSWPRGKWSWGEFDGYRRLICYWDDVENLLDELNSYPEWPESDYPWGTSAATIREAEVFPIGKSVAAEGSSKAKYQYAIIRGLYTTRGPTWNELYGMFIDEIFEAGYNSFACDGVNLRWESDNAKVDENDAPIKHDAVGEYMITFHGLHTVPPWVLTRPGLSNANPFATANLGIVFGLETLKYIGTTIRGRYSLAKIPVYDVTAKFSFKWSGWNKFWRPGKNGGQWEEMVDVDGNRYEQHPPVAMAFI